MKKKKTKKKAGTEWATAYFNMGIVSQYKHCIVTWWFGVQFWLGEGVLQHGCAVAENCIATGRFVGWAIILQYTKLYCD